MTLHYLLLLFTWATHVEWTAFAPDSTGNGNHVVYGGNLIDALTVARHAGGSVVTNAWASRP